MPQLQPVGFTNRNPVAYISPHVQIMRGAGLIDCKTRSVANRVLRVSKTAQWQSLFHHWDGFIVTPCFFFKSMPKEKCRVQQVTNTSKTQSHHVAPDAVSLFSIPEQQSQLRWLLPNITNQEAVKYIIYTTKPENSNSLE